MINEKLMKGFRSVGGKLKPLILFLNRTPWLVAIILGFVINFTVESLHRHSLTEGVMHIVKSPLPFLFNTLIVITALSLAGFFKKRYFMTFLLSFIFLGFGIANSVVLANRVTPFEWADLQIVKLSIIRIYLNVFEIILLVLLIAAAIAALVLFFIKCPKSPVNYFKNAVFSVVCAVLLTTSLVSFRSSGILMSEHVKNLANAYKDYGFNYCFLCSMLDLGIDKPSQYDKDDVQKIVNSLESAAGSNNEVTSKKDALNNGDKPNIVFLQLETFFDVNHLSNIKFSENPIPNFTRLQKEYTSGYLTVPSIGAGTANTEFEVISGMSLEYFGVGEYPYKTILQKNSCESICFNLAKHGYSSHAIHNNDATFYDRNKVFENLGFDTFTSIEYMQDIEYTSNGWAKDDVLLDCIVDALDSTESSDLVYTISVQSHGKYPSDYTEELPITVTGFEDEKINRSFQYYVNQLNEVDAIVGDILDTLMTRDEKTIVVMFGDHLPSFDITEADLVNGDLFQTEYVIWDNFGMEQVDRNLYTYQLAAEVIGKIGCDEGIMTKLHQNFTENNKYRTWMEVLQYDTLYGQKYAYGGENNYPYFATKIQMGVNKVSLSTVDIDSTNTTVTITGKHFTDYSKILINGKIVTTQKIDNVTLMATNVKLTAGDYVSVAQIDDDRTILSQTQNYIVGGTIEHPILSVDTDNIIKPRGLSTVAAMAIIVASFAVITLSIAIIIVVRRKKTASKNQEKTNETTF